MPMLFVCLHNFLEICIDSGASVEETVLWGMGKMNVLASEGWVLLKLFLVCQAKSSLETLWGSQKCGRFLKIIISLLIPPWVSWRYLSTESVKGVQGGTASASLVIWVQGQIPVVHVPHIVELKKGTLQVGIVKSALTCIIWYHNNQRSQRIRYLKRLFTRSHS